MDIVHFYRPGNKRSLKMFLCLQIVTEVVEDPAFAREKARHEAVLAHQKRSVCTYKMSETNLVISTYPTQ